MANKPLLSLVFGLIFLAGAPFAATCAENAYEHMCGGCTFDTNGKVDDACWQTEQAKGVACFSASYPKEFTLYNLGMCPAVDTCLQRLERCRKSVGLNNDREDCKNDNMQRCFEAADSCAAAAAKDCNSEPPDTGLEDETQGMCDSILWMGFLLPAAFAFYKREDR